MLGVDYLEFYKLAAAEPQWALIVPVREPVMHYLSWYYYFGEPDSHMTVDQWVLTGYGSNGENKQTACSCPRLTPGFRFSSTGLVAEFGLKDEADVKAFIQNIVWGCANIQQKNARHVLICLA